MWKALVLALLLAGSAQAISVKKFDCESPADYLDSNGRTIITAITSFAPLLASVGGVTAMPSLGGWVDVGYTGIKATLLGFYLQLGGSPAAVINAATHLVCIDIDWSADTP